MNATEKKTDIEKIPFYRNISTFEFQRKKMIYDCHFSNKYDRIWENWTNMYFFAVKSDN